MHTRAGVRNFVAFADAGAKIIRVQHGVFADGFQTVRPERADVTITAEQDADVAEETANAADALRAVVVEAIAVAVLDHHRRRQIRGEEIANRNRPATGTAAAVWAGEGFVDVVMLHVRAEVAGPRDAEDRVHVRAIEIHECAVRMQ